MIRNINETLGQLSIRIIVSFNEAWVGDKRHIISSFKGVVEVMINKFLCEKTFILTKLVEEVI